MGRKVLCADDDHDDKELICEALSKIEPGIEVIHAENGVKAYQVMKDLQACNELPCLAIIDINMPLIGGREVVKRLMEDPELKNIPIAVFSTSGSPSDILYFAGYGIKVYVKPPSMKGLEKTVEQMLQLCV